MTDQPTLGREVLQRVAEITGHPIKFVLIHLPGSLQKIEDCAERYQADNPELQQREAINRALRENMSSLVLKELDKDKECLAQILRDFRPIGEVRDLGPYLELANMVGGYRG